MNTKIYFCADDYGISAEGNDCIADCLENGILNKVSVLPNGETTDFKKRLTDLNATISLHINLVEGYPMSNPEDVSLLLANNKNFKHSFIGLLLLSLSPKRKIFEKQVYKEIQSQIRFWMKTMGEDAEISIDSHQHTHMIPLIFKTLMRVIRDENLKVHSVRFPAEPITPYLLTPSLFSTYSPTGLIKQWLLKFLGFVNQKELKKSKITSSYFMGILFSGKLDERKIKKILPRYLKLAEKNNKNIEIGFHPIYIKNSENLIKGTQKSFLKFYFSPWRKTEYDTLLNLKF